MLKVLHLITDLNIGGAEKMLYNIISYMDKHSFSNTVISMTDMGDLGIKIEEMGVKVHTLGMKRGVPTMKGLRKLLRIIKIEQPDIFQTWLYHADLLGAIVSFRRKRHQLVWNIRCADMELNKYSILTTYVVMLCAKLSFFPKAIIVNSNAGKSKHKEFGYKAKRWELIPNGFDIDKFKPNSKIKEKLRSSLDIPADALLIGMVARYDPMKDYENFFSAVKIFEEGNNSINVHYVLVGREVTMDNKQLKGFIDQKLIYKFHLLGEKNDIPQIMSGLDIFCSSSISEGFPNVIGEAMACGVPCVATDAGDSAIIVGDTGLIVPVKEPVALAKAWEELLNLNGETRTRLGMLGRKRIEENYCLASIVKRYEDLYKELT